jgi:hypothetical protein
MLFGWFVVLVFLGCTCQNSKPECGHCSFLLFFAVVCVWEFALAAGLLGVFVWSAIQYCKPSYTPVPTQAPAPPPAPPPTDASSSIAVPAVSSVAAVTIDVSSLPILANRAGSMRKNM